MRYLLAITMLFGLSQSIVPAYGTGKNFTISKKKNLRKRCKTCNRSSCRSNRVGAWCKRHCRGKDVINFDGVDINVYSASGIGRCLKEYTLNNLNKVVAEHKRRNRLNSDSIDVWLYSKSDERAFQSLVDGLYDSSYDSTDSTEKLQQIIQFTDDVLRRMTNEEVDVSALRKVSNKVSNKITRNSKIKDLVRRYKAGDKKLNRAQRMIARRALRKINREKTRDEFSDEVQRKVRRYKQKLPFDNIKLGEGPDELITFEQDLRDDVEDAELMTMADDDITPDASRSNTRSNTRRKMSSVERTERVRAHTVKDHHHDADDLGDEEQMTLDVDIDFGDPASTSDVEEQKAVDETRDFSTPEEVVAEEQFEEGVTYGADGETLGVTLPEDVGNTYDPLKGFKPFDPFTAEEESSSDSGPSTRSDLDSRNVRVIIEKPKRKRAPSKVVAKKEPPKRKVRRYNEAKPIVGVELEEDKGGNTFDPLKDFKPFDPEID